MRIIFLMFIAATTLFAHRLYILADDDGKTLHVKSYFTKTKPCMNCTVNIISEGKIIDSAKTDDKGEATLPFRTKNMEIEVVASMGHKNSVPYESENDPVTEDKNLDPIKFLIAFGVLGGVFFLLRVFKRKS